MADKGKGIARLGEATEPGLAEKDEVLEINYLTKLRKVSEVVNVEEQTIRSFYIRSSGEEDNELDGDLIEELGEVDDDICDLHNLGGVEDTALDQNVGGTGEGQLDSDDDSFMADSESESCESEDSLEDDYEIHEDTEVSDEEEENLDYGHPVQERPSLRYAIDNGVNVKIIKSEKKMVIATCQEGCPFRLYASGDRAGVGYMLKTLVHEHMCARVYKNRRASVRWLAEHFKDKV
ncbi:hypothetical protein QN277_005628 [Acacia crassicarpa]|uniref:Transposase MuDR plant domain-containing protein n=1 Tax=Acacia crassicarpa TaxID=499986 RepID=A0AAE1IWQ3_9FABA|nr:hypothetical protein QN277_005628 [Acacia crassicarpa]